MLVHLGSRGYSIDGEVEELLGSDDVDDLVDVHEEVLALFLEVFGDTDVLLFGIDTGMDETVHVDVEVVDLWVGGDG